MGKSTLKLVGAYEAWSRSVRQGRLTRANGTEGGVLVRVHDDLDASPERLARLREDARLVARLQHESVLRLEHVSAVSGKVGEVFEAFECASAARVLRVLRTRNQVLSARVAVETAAAVGLALDEALRIVDGDRAMYHPGPTPDDVLVDTGGRVKVAGFRVLRPQDPAVQAPRGYAAPEGGIGPAAATYLVGALLVELLSGEPPPEAAAEPERHEASVRRALIRVLARPGDTPGEPVVQALRQALAHQPAIRGAPGAFGRKLRELAVALASPGLRSWAPGSIPSVQRFGADARAAALPDREEPRAHAGPAPLGASPTIAPPGGVPLGVSPTIAPPGGVPLGASPTIAPPGGVPLGASPTIAPLGGAVPAAGGAAPSAPRLPLPEATSRAFPRGKTIVPAEPSEAFARAAEAKPAGAAPAVAGRGPSPGAAPAVAGRGPSPGATPAVAGRGPSPGATPAVAGPVPGLAPAVAGRGPSPGAAPAVAGPVPGLAPAAAGAAPPASGPRDAPPSGPRDAPAASERTVPEREPTPVRRPAMPVLAGPVLEPIGEEDESEATVVAGSRPLPIAVSEDPLGPPAAPPIAIDRPFDSGPTRGSVLDDEPEEPARPSLVLPVLIGVAALALLAIGAAGLGWVALHPSEEEIGAPTELAPLAEPAAGSGEPAGAGGAGPSGAGGSEPAGAAPAGEAPSTPATPSTATSSAAPTTSPSTATPSAAPTTTRSSASASAVRSASSATTSTRSRSAASAPTEPAEEDAGPVRIRAKSPEPTVAAASTPSSAEPAPVAAPAPAAAPAEPPPAEAARAFFRVEFTAGDPSVTSLEVRCLEGGGSGPSVVVDRAPKGNCRVTGRGGDAPLIAMVYVVADRSYTCFPGRTPSCK